MNLDDLEGIKSLDKSNIRDSVGGFSNQVKQVWEEFEKTKAPQLPQINNIVLIGMGGSTYGGRIIKTLYADNLPVPFDINSDYHIPNYIGKNSLVIAASYSGNTEETVTSVEKAYQKGAKILGLTCKAGSNLGKFCREKNIPLVALEPKFNPSGQPRTGSGYMILGAMVWLAKVGFITLTKAQIEEILSLLGTNFEHLKVESNLSVNPAKQLAVKFFNKDVVLIASEFLEGALYPLRNPIHETGKNFATYFPLPDLNHHLLEGLTNPVSNKGNFVYTFIESEFYSGPIKRRIELTKEVIGKNNLDVEEVRLQAEDKLGQVFELIQLGNFTAFYLALLNNADPALIPWVTYFQETFRRKT